MGEKTLKWDQIRLFRYKSADAWVLSFSNLLCWKIDQWVVLSSSLTFSENWHLIKIGVPGNATVTGRVRTHHHPAQKRGQHVSIYVGILIEIAKNI